MSHTVVGLFKSTSDAQNAVSVLKEKGFDSSSIDMSVRNKNLTGSASSAASSITGSTSSTSTNETGGGIGRFFRDLFGGDETESDTYSDAANVNDAIVTVHAQSADQARNAADIMDIAGAIDAHEEASNYRQSAYGSGTTGTTATTGTTGYAVTTGTNLNDADSVKVIREDLQVGKREVETGGVRLRSRIIERPVEESIRLRSEHVSVNRTPVNRPASEADFKTFREGEIEMTETREVPVVAKTAQVVEEVSLGKEQTERTETVKDTVRHTEVDVEKIPGTDTQKTGYTGTGTSTGNGTSTGGSILGSDSTLDTDRSI